MSESDDDAISDTLLARIMDFALAKNARDLTEAETRATTTRPHL